MRCLTEGDIDELKANYIEYIPSGEQPKVVEIDVERSKKMHEYITIRETLRSDVVPLAELKQQTDRLWDKFRQKEELAP